MLQSTPRYIHFKMSIHASLIFFQLWFLVPSFVQSQITIQSVPASECAGNPFGTATFSTEVSLATGSQRIVAGDFWQQAGAQWNFSTKSNGIMFCGLGIPGWGAQPDIPKADHDALHIDDGNQWSLTLPTTPPSDQQFDIVFEAIASSVCISQSRVVAAPTAGPSGSHTMAKASNSSLMSSSALRTGVTGSTNVRQTPSNMGRSNGIAPTRTPVPEVKAKREAVVARHRYRKRSASGDFSLTIQGSWGCLQNPDGTVPSPSVTSNPIVESLCANNEISTVTQSWSTYGVSVWSWNLCTV